MKRQHSPNLPPLPDSPIEAPTPAERQIYDEVVVDAETTSMPIVDYANRRNSPLGTPQAERRDRYVAANHLLSRRLFGAEDDERQPGQPTALSETATRKLQEGLDIAPGQIAPIPRDEIEDRAYKLGQTVHDLEIKAAKRQVENKLDDLENTIRLAATQPIGSPVAKTYNEAVTQQIAALDGTLQVNRDLGVIAQSRLARMRGHADGVRSALNTAEVNMQEPRAELAAIDEELRDLQLREPAKTDTGDEPEPPIHQRIEEFDPMGRLKARLAPQRLRPGEKAPEHVFRMGRAREAFTDAHTAYSAQPRVAWERRVAELKGRRGVVEARVTAGGTNKGIERSGEAGIVARTIQDEQSTAVVDTIEDAIHNKRLTIDYGLPAAERAALNTDSQDLREKLADAQNNQYGANNLESDFYSAQSLADLEGFVHDLNQRIAAIDQKSPKAADRDPLRSELVDIRNTARRELMEAVYTQAHLRIHRQAREGSDGRTPVLPLAASADHPHGAIYYPAYDTAITVYGEVFRPTPEESATAQELRVGLGGSALYGAGLVGYEQPRRSSEAEDLRNASIHAHDQRRGKAHKQHADSARAVVDKKRPLDPIEHQRRLIGMAALHNEAHIHALNAAYYDRVATRLRADEAAKAAAEAAAEAARKAAANNTTTP